MTITAFIEKQRLLIQGYEQLDLGMKKILQVASVAKPLARTGLISLAAEMGVTHEDGRTPCYKDDRDALNATIDQGLMEYVEKSKTGPVEIATELNDYVYRQAFQSGLAKAIVDADDARFSTYGRTYYYDDEETTIRHMRMAFYGNDWKTWKELASRSSSRPYVLDPFCLETFRNLDPAFQADLFVRAAENVVNFGDYRRGDMAKQACDNIDAMKQLPDAVIVAAIDLLAARGDTAGLQQLARRVDAPRSEILGCIEFLQGNDENARKQFDAAVSETKKRTKKRHIDLKHIPSIFYGLLLLKENSPQSQKQLKQVIKVITNWEKAYWMSATPLSAALDFQIAPTQNTVQPRYANAPMSPLGLLLAGLNWCWFYSDQKPAFDVKAMEGYLECYEACNMNWLAAEFGSILSRVAGGDTQRKYSSFAEKTHAHLQTNSLVDFIQPLAPWEAALAALENLCLASDKSAQSASEDLSDERLIWELDCRDGSSWIDLTPFIQKLGRKGWSKGRKVGLGRLYENWQSPEFHFLTDQDRSICKWLKEEVNRNYYGYRESYYAWSQAHIGKAIVGHPQVYLPGQRDEPLQITESRPHLTIENSGQQIKLAVQPQFDGETLCVSIQGSHRISIVQFSDRQQKVAELVASLPAIPRAQSDRVGAVARSISSVIDVQSDIDGAQSSGEEVVALSCIVVQLTPYQDGLRAELFVQPLGEHGPFCRPGVGARSVFANVDGRTVTTTRDQVAERKNMQQLLADCQPLDMRTVSDEQTEWLFEESDNALELVMELQTLAEQDRLTVLWPRGKSHQVAGRASNSNLQIAVKRDRDWFAATGELKVDDGLTLDLMKLLDLVSDNPSSFIQLDDGRFLALTSELRQRIADIAAYGTTMKNKVRFDPIRSLVLDELLENTSFTADKHWKSYIARIEEASTIAVTPPSTLQAELRDYQTQGYAWLKRMTHWNTGACLADDMGLGKTIQALGLLIERSPDGPSLVVAPASVGFNWESETHKFAPTLTPKQFRECDDRGGFFEDLQPGDLVITSYGLLQSEIQRFEDVHWSTILLDEAQAIKNMATKRSQAVMQLRGDFRLILTGTPMENHLGELWNLFRFIVPGLLGSNEDFRKRFAIPIERDNCRRAQHRLKKLIQPFLLRRTKTEVLSELPSRSESVLEVELSPREIALYEALRQKAIKKIEEANDDPKSRGQRHLQVLAELTRLRLSCCHPALVGGEGIESTKLDLFRQKITEIIEGKHKVLVFSQFVKYLEILRKELDAMAISYQYLDGSTSMKKRKQAVEAFQSGEGDVFLISLKAGGTGLNLTAADYVIHMDPWWNPAVEDQATDRAHRIGQQRPVNVYRLITKGTIEEKIVDLHNTKRDLADNLLAGSDNAGNLSTEDLINLLKDNQLVELAT